MAQVCEYAHSHSMQVHLDGARLLNAALALGVEPRQVAEHCDSVSMCLSKGLCCPVGTMLAGSKEFIGRAVRFRKMLGGGLRQAGLIAAAGIYALDHMVLPMADDHRIARLVEAELQKHALLEVLCSPTNIVYFKVRGKKSVDVLKAFKKHNILLNEADSQGRFRLVVHHYIREAEVAALGRAAGELEGVRR
jgi:threonine aldolase